MLHSLISLKPSTPLLTSPYHLPPPPLSSRLSAELQCVLSSMCVAVMYLYVCLFVGSFPALLVYAFVCKALVLIPVSAQNLVHR